LRGAYDPKCHKEYLLLLHPVVVGNGKRLFGDLEDKINFKLIETKAFKWGVVVLRFTLKK
jgi:dihydrofolate reductase